MPQDSPVPQGTVPPTMPGKAVWVTPPSYQGGRVAGLLVEWRRIDGDGYEGRVVWAEPGSGAAVIHERWLHVRHIHERK